MALRNQPTNGNAGCISYADIKLVGDLLQFAPLRFAQPNIKSRRPLMICHEILPNYLRQTSGRTPAKKRTRLALPHKNNFAKPSSYAQEPERQGFAKRTGRHPMT